MYLSVDKLLGNWSKLIGSATITPKNDYAKVVCKSKSYCSYELPVEAGEEYTFTFFAKKTSGTPKVRILTDNYPSVSDEVTILSNDYKKYSLKVTIPYTSSRNSSMSIDIGGIEKAGSLEIFNPIINVTNTSHGTPQVVAGAMFSGVFDYSVGQGPSNKSVWKNTGYTENFTHFGISSYAFNSYLQYGALISYCDIVLAQKYPNNTKPIVNLTPNISDLCKERIIPTIHSVENSNGEVTVRIVFFTPGSTAPTHTKGFSSVFSISVSKS